MPGLTARLFTVSCRLLLVAAVLVCLGGTVSAGSLPETSIIVLPPAIRIATATWAQAGIQDSMTVDLWGVASAKALPITEYGRLATYSPENLSGLTRQAAVELARRAGVSQIWLGEYLLEPGSAMPVLAYTIVDSKSGNVLQREQHPMAPDEIPQQMPRLMSRLLAAAKIKLTAEEAARIATPKTRNPRAFEQNSLAFSRQIRMFGATGHTYTERHNWVRHGERAVELDSAYAEAHVNLGWAYYADRSMDAAYRSFATATRLKPHLLDAWMGLGYIQRDRGDHAAALDSFRQATTINPTLDWPRKELNTLIALVTPPAKQETATAQAAPAGGDFENGLSPAEQQLVRLAEQHDSREVRLNAITNLATSKGAQALPFLKRMLERRDLAFEVLTLIAEIDVAESVPYMIEALEKRQRPDNSRLAGLTEHNILGVLQFLRNRSLQQATRAVVPLLRDESPAVREGAAITLGAFGKKEAIRPLHEMVAAETHPLVSLSALVALVELGDANARTMLKDRISSGDDRTAANHAIKLLKQRNISLAGH